MYAINQLEKGRSASEAAADLGAIPRHIRRLRAEFGETGSSRVPLSPGRPALPPPSQEVQLVPDAYKPEEVGALRTAISLRRAGHDMSYQRACRIMGENGLAAPFEAKSRKRRWVRYERKYSNPMWHADLHVMKDPRMRGLRLITFLDDASRCVAGAGLFSQAASENAVVVLRQAIRQFGTPATVLSDNKSCFVGVRKGSPKGSWKPTAFGAELPGRGSELINSRPYHPQTNGKLERRHRTIEEIVHYESLPEYIKYYNERRHHFSLDISNCGTPLKAL